MSDAVQTEKPKFRIGTVLGFLFLFALALIPTLESFLRAFFSTGLPSSDAYIYHLVLVVAFVGGMITSSENRHLSIEIGMKIMPPAMKRWVEAINAFFSVSMNTAFGLCSLSFILLGLDTSRTIGVIPVQAFGIVMPLGFFFMAARAVTVLPKDRTVRLVAALGFVVGFLLSLPSVVNILYLPFPTLPAFFDTVLELWNGSILYTTLPLIIVLIAAGVLGTPIFVVLGGIGFLLFARTGSSLEVIPNEAFALLTGNTMPAIPLFTFAGFILSESKAGERIFRVFKSLFGWLPGGVAIVAILVSAFFTTFTGASGVTILALGGLLYYALTKSGSQSEKFSTGLLTAVGSIGILFPPSLPIILYGVSAGISVIDMFLGGILPGIVMIVIMSVFSVIISVRTKASVTKFDLKEALSATRDAIWELLLPVLIVVGYFTGYLSLVETSAVAVMYALIIEVVVHREIKVRDLPHVALKALSIIGGVLMILALAKGLSYFIVDVEVPMMLSDWVQTHIHSKFVFLLLLNLALLVVGCFMDIFSAILVVVPLITPLGALFDIHPVHLGIIFITNLEIGFLTPPVGMNLFLSSYRFERPLVEVYKNVMPFLLIQLVVLAIITYVPWFSTALLGLIKF